MRAGSRGARWGPRSWVPAPPCAPQMAFRYLSWILFPLLGCYAVYSLLYLEHKGWYSWVLSMLYGFLLTFGEQALTIRGPRSQPGVQQQSSAACWAVLGLGSERVSLAPPSRHLGSSAGDRPVSRQGHFRGSRGGTWTASERCPVRSGSQGGLPGSLGQCISVLVLRGTDGVNRQVSYSL